MDELNETNYRDYDLDWFAKINGKYIHVATAGGEVPTAIQGRFKQYSEVLQVVAEIPQRFTPNIDGRKILRHLNLREGENPQGYEAYVAVFKGMAMKGFYSFDKQNITDPDDNHYILVAEPDEGPQERLLFKKLDGLIPPEIEKDVNFEQPVDLVELFNKP